MLRVLVLLLCLSPVLLPSSAFADDDDDDNRDVTPIEAFLTADVGYRMLQINKFEIDGEGDVTPELIPATSHGVAPGAQLGVRLWFVSLAVRGEVAFFQATQGEAFDDGQFRLYSVDGELALRLPLGRLHPYLLLGGGYSGLGGLSNMRLGGQREGSSQGANVRGGGGFDVLAGRYGVFGLRATIEGLFLSSTTPIGELLSADGVDTSDDAEQRAREVDGSLGGYSAAISLLAGVRI